MVVAAPPTGELVVAPHVWCGFTPHAITKGPCHVGGAQDFHARLEMIFFAIFSYFHAGANAGAVVIRA